MNDRKNGLTYADSGVDIDAGNRLVDLIKPMVRATARAGADAEIGGFGGLFDLKAAGFNDPVLVAATDGVGTKVKIAIETGLHGGIGIDLVAMSVNDLVVQGAEPLFFLDYFACGKLDPQAAAAIVAGVAEGCRESGCALIGGETAEMPGFYSEGEYDIAGFIVGVVDRAKIIDGRGTASEVRAKAIVPSTPQAASVLRSCVVVRRVLPFPSGRILQRPSCPPGPFDQAIWLADCGDQVGATSSFESVVSRRSADPSGLTTQMSGLPVRVETKAMRPPSGDHAGSVASPVPVGRSVTSVPSASIR